VLTAIAVSLAFSSLAKTQDQAGKIVFVSDRDGNPEIYSMLSDGSNVKRLTSDPGKDVSPCWSPDGKQIAWASNRSGNWDIWIMNEDGSGPINLTDDKEHQDTNPMWAKSDGSIAFVANRHFYTIQANGNNLYERTGLLLSMDCQPSVSPLALRFCLRDGSGHMLIQEGWEVHNVLPLGYGTNNVPAQIYHPSWSSDAADIIFDSGGATSKIFTVDVQDKTCDSVSFDGYGYEPVFGPGDTTIIFTSAVGEGKGSDIFSIALDAAERSHDLPKPTNLTRNPGNDNEPAYWEPKDARKS
jgi:Tol biopolymer transport system component